MSKIWKRFLIAMIALAVVAGIAAWTFHIVRPVRVTGYYLDGSERSEPPFINVIIENGMDEIMKLDRITTYPEAIRMVDSLNKTIR